MRDVKPEEMRNIVLLGHGNSGKTTLSEVLLYDAGAISRLGTVEEKNTVSDYDDDEHARGISVNLSILPFEWQGRRVTLLDAPGYTDFVGEVKAGLRAADGAVLVVCAASGVEVGAELQWQFADETSMPRIVFINKMDRDNASYERTLEQLRTKFEAKFVPVTLPIGSFTSFAGIIDLLSMKAYMGADGKEAEIPADMRDAAEAARMEMMEFAAESDDELMLKYLDDEDLTLEEIVGALAQGAKNGDLVLVFVGSATKNIGTRRLLDAMVSFMPSPAEVCVRARNAATGEEVELSADPAGPLVAQVFKTMADPFVGKLTYFRVFSGTLTSDSRVQNMNRNSEERVGQLFTVRGKEQTPAEAIQAGGIGAVAKLSETTTGDTLGIAARVPDARDHVPRAALFGREPQDQADLDK